MTEINNGGNYEKQDSQIVQEATLYLARAGVELAYPGTPAYFEQFYSAPQQAPQSQGEIK